MSEKLMSATSPSQSLRVLTIKDAKKAARTLLSAFKNDALAKLLVSHFHDQESKNRCELTLYEAYLKQHVMKGIVLGINESEHDFETVAIWSTPESESNGLDSFATLMESGYGELWDICGEEGRQKIFYGMLPLLHDSFNRIMKNDSRFHGKGVYTLVYVGSTESAKGKGNVRKMFDYMFEKHIDTSPNNIAYLESSSVVNIPIYNRFGFIFYEDIILGSNEGEMAVEGEHYAIMNVMIRGFKGADWSKQENTFLKRGKL